MIGKEVKSRKYRLGLVFCLVLAFFGLGELGAQTIVLKISCIAPENSPYGKVIKKMRSEWLKISNGKVDLRVYFGGTAGDELDTVRKMRIGQLNGGLITLVGISSIDKDLITLATPLLIRNNEELGYVLQRLRGEIEQRISAKGYVPIALARAGWLKFFSKTPFMLPEEVRVRRLGVSDEVKDLYTAYQLMGYRVVPVEISETLAALNTGLQDTVFTTPLVAGGYQWFGIAKYMLDLNIAPFIGAFIVEEKAWNRIPADLRAQLIQSAQEVAESELDKAIDVLEGGAVGVMTQNGLNVIVPTPQAVEAWEKELERGLGLTLGKVFNKDLYDRIKAILAERR